MSAAAKMPTRLPNRAGPFEIIAPIRSTLGNLGSPPVSCFLYKHRTPIGSIDRVENSGDSILRFAPNGFIGVLVTVVERTA